MKAADFDLSALLKFDAQKGAIHLGEERMLLFRQEAFATLRRLLFEQVGSDMARSILMKFGYQNGISDFETLSQMFPCPDDGDRLALGPLMHSWSGIVHVEPLEARLDRATGDFYFQGRWHNSYEAEIHLRSFGRSDTPVCFSLAGYGSGWCTAFFGQQVIEVETKCRACGDPYCEWEIRPVNKWDDRAKNWLQSLTDSTASIYKNLEETTLRLRTLNEDLEKVIIKRSDEYRSLTKVLCHDLIFPLNTLTALAAKAKDGTSLTSQDISRLEIAKESVEKMLDQARSRLAQELDQAQQLQNLEPVHLGEVFAKVKLLLTDLLNDKCITLNIDPLVETKTVIANAHILRDQVFNNILTNAVKFSLPGSPIDIAIDETCPTKGLGVRVRDHGHGMPQKILKSLSDPTGVDSTPGTQSEKGSGFGLAIMRHYVEKMGGCVGIESTSIYDSLADCGTTVTVWLPVAAVCKLEEI